VLVKNSTAQTIVAEGFEGYYPPNGWAVTYASSAPNWLQMPPSSGHQYAGLRCINVAPSGTFAANAWIFSPILPLSTGVSYRITYWYKAGQLGRAEKMKVTLGSDQTAANQTTIIHDYPSITSTTHQQGIDVFTVSSSGNYSFAFNCYTGPGGGPGFFMDSIRLEYVTAAACNSTPPTGTITGVDNICSGTPFTLLLNGIYNTTGLNYQWQSSPAGLGNFQDVPGATTNLFSFTQSSSQDYRCRITCTATGQVATSLVKTVTTPTICYCTPPPGNCISAAGSYAVTSVAFESINSATGCDGNGYSNFTGTIAAAPITAGSAYPITVQAGNNNSSTTVVVGIDYNQNGNFESPEIKILTRNAFTHTSVIPVPSTALGGITRMRVGLSDGTGGNVLFGCSQPTRGETEDYLVNITPSTAGPYFSFFVKANASGANTGVDWANAFTDLSSALAIAGPGDTIKVAKGTYTPATYYAMKDSIRLWGGYPNTGNPGNADRNWSLHQTIISGNDARLNLLVLFNGVHAETEINGFIFEKGSSHNNGGNPVIPGVCISTRSGSPTISNCVFRNNKNFNSDYGGSSVFCDNSNAVFTNCFFLNNTDTRYGTIYCTGTGSPSFYNCVIAKNTGPAIAYSSQANIKLINSTFFGNTLTGSDPSTILLASTSGATIANSIFYENKSGNTSDSTDLKLNAATVSVLNTITQVYNPGSPSLISVSPKFVDSSNITGPDNLYFTNDDGLQLVNPCSNAINAGNNAAVAGIANDLSGRPRIFGSNVDLGAYVVQAALTTVPSVLYVNANAAGLNNGTSWINAYTNLQSALQNCSDTIKVAAGTYYPSSANKYAAFWLESHRILLGGYPNTGNPGNTQRDPVVNPTILSGNLPSGSHAPLIVKGRHVDNTSVLDGFIISDGLGESSTAGALYILNDASPKIVSTVLKNNLAPFRSSAITVLNGSSPEFKYCTLENNIGNSSLADGAVRNDHSTPRFTKCDFKMNSSYTGSISYEYGGAMVNINSNAIIDSCLFFKNTANDAGGAIANFNSSPVISNSSFIGNMLHGNVQMMATDIYNDHSNPVVTNCIFSDSALAEKGGSIAHINNSNALYTNCEFRNCKAIYDGSISYSDNSTIEFNRCSFQGSSLGSSANTISNINNSNCKIVNSIAFSNSSNSFVGMDAGNLQVINSTIAKNAFTRLFVHGGAGQLTVSNSILWDNVNANFSEILSTGSATVSVNNTMSQSLGTNGVNGNRVGINPRLTDVTNAPGPDGIIKTSDDGFILCSCSPAINTGNNTAIAGYTNDVLNNTRVFGSNVDIGSYEFQSAGVTIPGAYYVRQTAPAGNDGLSWPSAYNDLQKAIRNTCADTIKITAGIYKPAVVSRDSSFFVNRGIVIYGGYPNTATPAEDQRDPDINPTIISGEMGPAVDSSDNSKMLFWVNSVYDPVTIDGLSFTRAHDIGAVKSTNNIMLTVRNSRFYNNYTGGGSAGLTSQASNIEVDKCIFSENGSLLTGSGTLRIQSNQGYAVIKNSIFWNNSANFGGAAYADDSARFENCLFYANNSYYGGGIYLQGNPAAKITNCTFFRNNTWATEYRGTDLYDGTEGTSRVVVRNTVFKDQLFHNNPHSLANSDWYRATTFGPPPSLNVQYSVTATDGLATNSLPSNFTFIDPVNPKGTDNKWFTADDGLYPDPCTPSINTGNNASVTAIPTDITGSPRIVNGTVDRGAYESKGLNVTISTATTSICPGASVTFTSVVINGGVSPTYQWKVNGINAGTNSNTFTTATLVNGDQVTLQVTSSIACLAATPVTSNMITILVSGLPASVTIAASATTICAGTTVTFTATPVNGGPTPSYQWQVNGVNAGANSNTFSSGTLTNGAEIKVLMTTSLSCATPAISTSNIITMVVNPVPVPSVSVSSSAITICAGTGVTFTAIPTNGGTTPAYQWQVNGINAGTNNPVFSSSTLTNGDQVKVILTSNATCAAPTTATSNTVTMTVNALVVPAVSISASSTTICAGTNVTFIATPTNGGSGPSYQWQVNGINTGTNSAVFSSTTLATGDQVKVTMTSNAPCASPTTATSNTVAMTVNATLVPAVSISASSTNICPGTNVTFTATPTNGGFNPVYQWQVNGVNAGTNNAVFSSTTLINGDLVKVIMTSNAPCASPVTATSNAINMTVNATVTPSIVISGTTTVLTGQNTTISSAILNGGGSPQYQWQDSTSTHNWQNIPGATNAGLTYTPVLTGDKIRCQLVSNANCANPVTVMSNALAFTVNTVTAVTPVPGSSYGIVYYPNPSTGILFIDSLRLSDKWQTLQVMSMDGKQVMGAISLMNQTKKQINVERLIAGHYILILKRKSGTPAYLKFIKL
jgi:hypothetical protein